MVDNPIHIIIKAIIEYIAITFSDKIHGLSPRSFTSNKVKKISYFIALFYLFNVNLNTLQASNTLVLQKNFINQEEMQKQTKKYGLRARKRLQLWNKMMLKAQEMNELEKLKAVNNYFNRIKYLSDQEHWGKNDYWATMFEFIGSGAGDCEDFATAKYFSLKLLGVADKKMELTYVKLTTKQKKFDANHMVLSYFNTPNTVPILLDNANLRLALASDRPDINPIFSFNANGLLKSKHKGKPSKRVQYNLAAWQQLMERY